MDQVSLIKPEGRLLRGIHTLRPVRNLVCIRLPKNGYLSYPSSIASKFPLLEFSLVRFSRIVGGRPVT